MAQIEEKIKKAFDTPSWESKFVNLNEEQADRFIDYIVDESMMMKESRVIRMNKPIKTIAKIGIGDKIFKPGKKGRQITNETEATTSSIQLQTHEIDAKVSIYDSELEDNIEGEAFANHLLQMVAKKGANQIERASLYGRQKATDPDDAVDIDQQFNGFITRAEDGGHVVDANDTGLFSDRLIEEAKLKKLYRSFDLKYRPFLDGFYVPEDIVIDWNELYNKHDTTTTGAENRSRYAGKAMISPSLMRLDRPVIVTGGLSTTLDADALAGATTIPLTSTTGLSIGDSITIGNADPALAETRIITVVNAGVSVEVSEQVYYDHVSGSTAIQVSLNGTDILMTPKQNLIYGIQRDMRIEPLREPDYKRTSFFMTMRLDVQVENLEAIGILKNLKISN